MLEKRLRKEFPYGHPGYIPLTLQELQLHNDKNHDFAKGGDPLGNFKRTSAIKKLYPGFDWDSPFGTAVDYLLKQFDAMMHMRAQSIKAEVENIPTRLKDMVVYGKIAILLYEEEQKDNGLV